MSVTLGPVTKQSKEAALAGANLGKTVVLGAVSAEAVLASAPMAAAVPVLGAAGFGANGIVAAVSTAIRGLGTGVASAGFISMFRKAKSQKEESDSTKTENGSPSEEAEEKGDGCA
ncbi:hypothetical protein GGR51DRAFT_561376 [Nemania sp. FL0031]|nr:hypothetical protein GGR51DRAFT_561376 [Nemania sp. FL0031]